MKLCFVTKSPSVKPTEVPWWNALLVNNDTVLYFPGDTQRNWGGTGAQNEQSPRQPPQRVTRTPAHE